MRLSRCLCATVAMLWVVVFVGALPVAPASAGQAPYRILHIMSYHTPWRWTEEQLAGFKDALQGVDAEYRVFEMDTKRNSSEEWKREMGAKARAMIDEWQPDLVYTNDDNAQQYVVAEYPEGRVPFVFSGVNAASSVYGFDRRSDVTGVMEQEHAIQTLNQLRQIVPGIKRIAVIVDEGPTWPAVLERLRSKIGETGIEVVAWERIGSYREYREKLLDYQDKVDAVGILGIFTFRDEAGNNVPYQEVLRWTADNSRLPDFSFWRDRVDHGTLCVVSVSGYAQGHSAGEMARRILLDGVKPADIPMSVTVKGEPLVSLARARRLGISVPSSVLLSSRVVTDFAWQR